MLENFLYAFNAVMPIVLTIGLGYLLKRIGFFTEAFLKVANRLVFKVCLPALLFCNVYSIEKFSGINWGAVLYGCGAIVFLFLLGWIGAMLLIPDDRQKGVFVQCMFRSNYAIIGLSFAQSIGGDAAAEVVGVLSAFTIPLFNILAVIAMAGFVKDDRSKGHLKKTFRKILTNPLIIGCLIGFLVVWLRALLPVENGVPVFTLQRNMPFLYNVISSLGKMASPLALLVLGGQFDFCTAGHLKRQLLLGTVARIVVAPLIGLSGAVLLASVLHFTAAEYASFIGLFGSPVAVSTAVMAAEMGNDERLAGQYVVWTSVGSVFTVFFTVLVLKAAALL